MSKISIFLVLLLGLTFSSSAISVERKVFPDEIKKGQSVIVTITVKKEGEEGFAKLMENIPEDFKAEELNSATGNFICEDGKLRIIWLTMPDGETFRAEYKLVYEGASSGSFDLGGKFYYVKEGKRTEYNLRSSSVRIVEKAKPKEDITVPEITTNSIEPKDDAVETADIEGLDKEDSSEETADKDSPVENNNDIIVDNTDDSVENNDDDVEDKDDDIKTESLKSEVVFKVQLGVFSKEKDIEVFGNLPEVHFIKVGNLYKYYSGKFTSEYEARSNIDKARLNGFSGAFLVRFKDGKRL